MDHTRAPRAGQLLGRLLAPWRNDRSASLEVLETACGCLYFLPAAEARRSPLLLSGAVYDYCWQLLRAGVSEQILVSGLCRAMDESLLKQADLGPAMAARADIRNALAPLLDDEALEDYLRSHPAEDAPGTLDEAHGSLRSFLAMDCFSEDVAPEALRRWSTLDAWTSHREAFTDHEIATWSPA